MKFKKFLSCALAATFFSLSFSFSSVSAANEVKTPSDEVIFSNFEGDENFKKFMDSLPQKSGDYKSSQRPIMIEGAMNIEIDNFVKSLEKPVIYKFLNYVYFAGTYKNYPVIVARTEQGVGNAAVVTAVGIQKFNPIAVINQGTAGAHIPSLHIGDIVIGEKIINAAAYKTEYAPAGAGINLTSQEMRGTFAYNDKEKTFTINQEYLPDKNLLRIAENVADTNKKYTVVKGTISSSDTWLSGIDHMKFLHEKYGSVCEEMEEAAAAQMCKSSNVPFIGIRAISNNITNGEQHSPASSLSSQSFVLLVVGKYIDELSKK